ncbi:MAG TPA: S9 family peptidase [Myxococcaceae bacterium]|nr:S9 family peptidase [Myxococcaceae bacterium]
MSALLLVSLLAAAPALTTIDDAKPVPENPNLLASGVPAIPPELRARVDQYLNARSAELLDVAEDGTAMLIATRFASTAQIHLVRQPMGARTQLTFGVEPIGAARFVRGAPETLLYLQDVGGGEFYQVYRLDRRTGRSELLTDGKSRHESLQVSRDGKRFAFSSSARNGKDTDVYVAEMARPREARRIVEAEGSWYAGDFSPDGTRLLVTRFRAIDDADLYVVDVASGDRRQITPAQGKGSVRAAAWAADGKSAFLVTDRYSDFDELYRIDLATPAASPVSLTRSLKWNVEDVAVAPDGSRVAFAANVDGYGRLFLLDRGGRTQSIDVPAGVISRLQFPERRSDLLAFSLHTPRHPADAFTFDLKKRKLMRWTESEVGGLDPGSFVQSSLVRYPSADGVVVPAFVYRPRPGSEGKRAPVVLVWHGGPEAQSRPAFSSTVQLLATELRFAVVLPNVRGSDGYGKAFRAMDDGVKREASLADIGATLDWIARQPDLDSSRVAAFGGSYGGYMTLASAAFFPERFAAAVDLVGISNIVSFLESTQAYRRDLRRPEYGDERNPEVRAVQERISPLHSASKIRSALFVLQGKNDPRVPQSEAEQIVKAVRANGREAWYLLALNEGHGFAKKENRDYSTAAIALFLEQQLGSAPPGTGGARGSSP